MELSGYSKWNFKIAMLSVGFLQKIVPPSSQIGILSRKKNYKKRIN